MKHLATFAAGVAFTLTAIYVMTPASITNIHPVEVIERTVHTSSNYTITTSPDTTGADPHLDDQLNAECAWALARHTDDPMAGLLIHIERRWSGDSCAALEHYHQHGWY